MTAPLIGSVAHTQRLAVDLWQRGGNSAYTGARENSTACAGLSRANFGYRNEAMG